MSAPQLICIIGAESTGKTTLAQQLATRFACLWVPEYLRTFCDDHGRTPHRDEQSLILETQHIHELAALEQARTSAAPFVFCDTAPLTTAIYSDYVFADRSLYARGRALHARYALTLLLAPDLGWTADGILRESPEAQANVNATMERELASLDVPVVRIFGGGDLRLRAALAFLENDGSHSPHL